MRGMSFRLLHEMMQEKTQNIFLSPVWILKSGIVSELEKYYIKVYFFANEDRLDIKELYFKLHYNEQEFDLMANEFVRANSYKNDKVFGCTIPFPTEFVGEEYSILFTGVKLGDTVYDYSNHERGDVYFDVFIPSEKKKFLRENVPYYLQFPRKGETYWQCTCGQHNPIHATNCYECFKEKSIIDQLLEDGIDKVFLNYYVHDNPFVYNPMMSLKDTYDEYTENISKKYSIDLDYVREFIDYSSILENESKMIDEYNERTLKQKKEFVEDVKHKAIVVSSIIGILLALFLITVYGPKSIKYISGYYHLSQKEYSLSLDKFYSANGFLNSEDMVNEVYYQWSNDLSETNVSKSISLLEQIPNLDYKDTKDRFLNLAEQYGVELYESKQYEEAIHYLSFSNRVDKYLNDSKYQYLLSQDFGIDDVYEFTLLEELVTDRYKDSKEWLERLYYEAALKAIDYNFKDKAIKLLDNTSYGDAKDIQVNLVTEQVNALMLEGDYDSSLDYVERIKDDPKGQVLYQEVMYRLANQYETNLDYEGALKHFLLIDGYKDSNKRIKYLKQTLAPWDVDIRFTESYNKDIDVMDKDSSIYIEITFSTPDKSNYFVSEIVFIFPDGQRDSFSPESMIEHDETLEFEFVNGFYQDSNYRPTGTFTVEVYYVGMVDILIGSKSIEVVD